MDFYGTTIYGNGIGIYNRQDRNAIIENVNIYGNTSAGIYNNAGTVAVKSGYIHENKSGIDNAGTLNISGGNVYENSVNGIVNTGTLNYSGGNIYGNASNGVVTNGTAEFSGGSIYSNAGSGLSVTGGTSTLKGSVAVRNNVGSGVYNLSGTVNINGGEIKDNGNSNVSNNGTLNMSGGSVHGTAAYGIANSKTLNISGGNVYDSSSSGIFNSGTVAKATITGGSFWSNGYDVYHAGEAGAAGLIINSGANSGNNMSVYLSYVDRYITTDSTHPFSVTIADSCYVRGKILVNTNPESVGSAAGVYAVMSFLDKNQLTADANKTFYVCYYPIKYIIHFDGNGSTSGSMSDIATLYDVPVTLPTHGYTRVTENGESTFKGWNIIPSPDHFEILYGENATWNNLTITDNQTITLYAIWDDYSGFEYAEYPDRYFSLKQAHDGAITEEELLSTVKVIDREDGELTKKTTADVAATGSDEGVTIRGYLAEEWTTFPCEGSTTMVYLAKDSMGHVTPLEITVHITSDEATEDNLVKEVRGISKEYYDTYKNADYSEEAYKNYGGLHPNSLWYTDPEYRACIEEAFENEENNTPEQVWVFTPEDHVKVKEFITEHSIGNSKEPDALKKFLEEFAYCRKK